MISTNSEAVAVASHLPYAEFWMAGFNTCGDSSTTSMYSVETVGVQVVRHTARTSNTRNHYCLMRWNPHLCHCFLQCHTYSMIATTWAKLYILITLKLTCFHTIYYKVGFTKFTILSTAKGWAVISLYCSK